MNIKDKIIVALDVESCDSALSLVENLRSHANFFKVGLGLIGKGGLELASEIKTRGHRVFLDLKLFDISNTIENAVNGLCDAKFDFLTVQGDPHVIKAAVKGRGSSVPVVREECDVRPCETVWQMEGGKRESLCGAGSGTIV